MFRRGWLLLWYFIIISLSACSLIPGVNGSNQAEIVSTPQPFNNEIPTQQNTPEAIAPVVITDTTRVLRVWVPPSIVPTTEAGTAVLQEQINNYALTQTDLDIILETKVVSGQGGILSYLRTGRNIAPEILPDLIAIPAEQLSTVSADGLIYPLNGLIEQDSIESLYPAAQTFAMSNDIIAGYPFALTRLTHFAYNTTTISQTISTEWDNLTLSGNSSIGIPLAGREGGVFVLQLYQDAGGSLVNEAGQLSLQSDALAFALTKLRDSAENNQLNVTISQGSSVNEMWDAYNSNRADIILTTAESYLIQPELGTTAVSPVSGITDALTPTVFGWAWAISTPNNSQQLLATELLTHLTTNESLSVWSQQNNILPANPESLAQWTINESYQTFLQIQLTSAEAIPPNATLEILNLLQVAALQVISGDVSPQSAAETAASSLQE